MNDNGWLDMGLAFALFLASHGIPVRPGVRKRLVGLSGEAAYLVLYSALSFVALAVLLVAAGRAPYVELWPFQPWQLWMPNLAMPAACLLIAFSVAAPNPLSFGAATSQAFDPDRPGIAGVARHPLLWVLVLWSASHIVPNGDLAHGLVFGGFAAFAILGMVAIDRRHQSRLGRAEWGRLARRTSGFPFAALAQGRWGPSGKFFDAELMLRLAGAAALYLAILILHEAVIGVSPMPVF